MKIEMSPKKIKVEIPNYGEFEVSPLGAGAEADIMVAHRKMKELKEATNKYNDLIEKDKAGEADINSPEYKEALEAFRKVEDAIENVKEITLAKLRAVFKGKNVEKLFQDFTYEQLSEIHQKATKDNG